MKYTHNINLEVIYFMKKIILFICLNLFFLNAQNNEQIKKQIKNSGLSVEQVKQIAKERGYTNDQIESMASESGSNLDGPNATDLSNSNSDIEKDISKDVSDIKKEKVESIDIQDPNELQYFGYQIFQGDPAAFQSSSFGAVDPNYNIGPGDQIILMLWGESQFRQEFVIDREGYVFIPEIGQVYVNGLNLESLEKKIFQILSKVYSTLNPQNGDPTTFMDISIGDLRPLRIIVLGEVSQPGAYLVSPSTSLSSSLYYFNGPTTFGSLRGIRLLRKGKSVEEIDFYDYLLSGNIPNDVRLQADDVIFIPPRGKSVIIKGEINRQGIYELKEDEGLYDILEIAGDLTVYAYTNRAQISRVVPNENRLELGMDRMILDIDLQEIIENGNNIEMYDGDIIEIFPIEEKYSNYVIINSNSVMRPGRYQLLPGMTVLDLINSAEGLLNDAYIYKAHIKRINDDLTTELISFNLKTIFDDDLDNNIKLKFMDELIIYNTNEINNVFNKIHIFGPVKNRGSYILDKELTLGDLIISAGGFLENVSNVKITVARSNKNNFSPKIYSFPSNGTRYVNISSFSNQKNEINNFVLLPNDIISVYSDPRDRNTKTVTITGAVYYPGIYPILSSTEKVSDIINRSGGLLPSAYPMASSFKRRNKEIKLSFESIINNKRSKDNFFVMENDSINISTKSNIVDVVGDVNQPGSYKYYDGYSLKRYLNLAGGLTTNAEKREIWVTYPNGSSKRLKRFLPSPRVYDSSIITVGSKPETEPVNKTEFAKEVASIISDFVQIALTIAVLSRNTSN